MPNKEITIREYKDSDYNRLLELSVEFSEFFDPLDPWRKEKQDFTVTAKHFLDKDIEGKNKNNGKIIVAQLNSKIIGFTSFYLKKQDDEELLYRTPMTIGYVESLFISKEYRNKGVGEKLMKTAEEYFREKRCTHSKLEVFGPNDSAKHFYIKHGYVYSKMEMLKTL